MAAVNRWEKLLEDPVALKTFSDTLCADLFADAETVLQDVIYNCESDATVEDVIATTMDVLTGCDPVRSSDSEPNRWDRLTQEPDDLNEVMDDILRLLFVDFENILLDVMNEYADGNVLATKADLILEVLDRMENVDAEALEDLEELVDGLTFVQP